MDQHSLDQYLADNPPSVVPLAIAPHFNALSNQEKLYAHFISLASWSGTRIVLRQVSAESEAIYDLIIELHNHCKGDWKALQRQSGLSDQDLQAFLNYAAQFLGNGGNFKSFGDSKFIPRLAERQFKALATSSPKALQFYEKAKSGIYAHVGDAAGEMHLGYPDAGHVSTYYPNSAPITKDEITAVSGFFDEKKLLPENTRVRKTKDGNFEVLIASGETDPAEADRDVKEPKFTLTGKPVEGKTATLVYGDHAVEMAKAAEAMRGAKQHALNPKEAEMTGHYVKSFSSGSLEAFKASQRSWTQDKGPEIECNVGFIETYRDPQGIRGEWEGFCAMVNKERTRAFGKLVESAPDQIPKLPWSKDFEKDKFLSPDFTSLEVLTFAGSGIPAGINIPNYDDIRQNFGFKNVSLGNVLSAKAPNEKIPFIRDSDLEVYQKYRDPAFEVQVGLHELLGHGCGKLLQETEKGKYNFDVENPPISPLTNKPITSWYKPGQTWGSVFGNLGASYEECRAECVAMSLGCDFDILAIFGFGSGGPAPPDMKGEAADVLYASYLSMARAGVAALEFWDPKSRKWGQAHMQARFSILRTFLDAGGDFCKLESTNKDDPDDLAISLDRSKILSHGRPAVDKYLQKLQIYKATADVGAGKAMYDDITNVDSWFAEKVRLVVLSKKQPRKVFVQANTVLGKDGNVELKEYDSTPEGMILSFAEREYI